VANIAKRILTDVCKRRKSARGIASEHSQMKEAFVTFDRVGSIFFYMLIAWTTCLMAYKVQPYQPSEPKWVNGQRTKKHFENRLYCTGIFLILFAVSVLRFDIGNDYRQYTQTAHEAYVGGYVVTEFGFNLLVKVLYWISGGEYYELVFAVFALVTLIFFLKAFIAQSESFSQSFFLFMTLGLYFQTFNTVRYYLALSVALFSMRYVLEKDFMKFVFWILVAAMFHKSVLLVIPVYWIASCQWKRWHVVAGLMVSLACYVAQKLILQLALLLYPSYKNTIYLEGGGSRIHVLRILAVLALYGWFEWYTKDKLKNNLCYKKIQFYGHLNLLAFAAGTFFSFLPVVTRIVYYFSVSQLFMIPLILQNIDDKIVQKRVGRIIYAVCIVYFGVFLLEAHQDGVGLLPYRSWLFETQRYHYK